MHFCQDIYVAFSVVCITLGRAVSITARGVQGEVILCCLYYLPPTYRATYLYTCQQIL